MMVTITDIRLIIICWSTVILTLMVTITDIYDWSILILKVDNDGYCSRHDRTYLWYTGLP